MRVLGINAVFHDSAVALVVDGVTGAAGILRALEDLLERQVVS